MFYKDLKKKINSLKLRIDAINEEKELNIKIFKGNLAEKESKQMKERILMEKKLEGIILLL